MKRKAVVGITALLGLGACLSDLSPLALSGRDYGDRWLVFAEPALAGSYRAVNLYDTERRYSGRLVLADGTAVALRILPPPPGDDLAFIAPALGLSFTAKRQSNGDLAGTWTKPSGEAISATLKAGEQTPAEADRPVVLPDGRRMHIVCAGEGRPTVLLDYGAGGTMKKDWGDLARLAAAKAQTKVCAYDRAGRGLSDPASLPRDAAAVASDIDAMLTAAKLSPPYILVGHSLGSYHVRQYANTRADKTAGLVLVDPSGDGQLARFSTVIPKMQAMQDARARTQADLDCVRKLVAQPVPPGDPFAKQCGGNDPDAIAATQSEIESMPGASTEQLVASRRSYGAMPVIVLTRGDYDKDMPPDFTIEDRAAMKAVWETMHAEMAALSTAGEQRRIPSAGHYIQRDNPEAVLTAIADVVAKVRQTP